MHRTPKWSTNCESFAYFGETKTQMERVNSRTWRFAWSFSRGRRLEDSRSSLSLCSEVFWDGGWAYLLCGWRDLVQASWGPGEPLRFTVTSLLCSCHSETLLDRLVTWQTFRGRSQKPGTAFSAPPPMSLAPFVGGCSFFVCVFLLPFYFHLIFPLIFPFLHIFV